MSDTAVTIKSSTWDYYYTKHLKEIIAEFNANHPNDGLVCEFGAEIEISKINPALHVLAYRHNRGSEYKVHHIIYKRV